MSEYALCLLFLWFKPAHSGSHRPWQRTVYVCCFSELVLGSIEQKMEDRKQQLKDQAEEERRMKILTS